MFKSFRYSLPNAARLAKFNSLYATVAVCVVVQAIKAVTMTPGVFRDAFHRIFLVHLSFPEIGALINALDESSYGVVDGAKFVTALYKLGKCVTCA